MHRIRISVEKNPFIYRVVQVPSSLTIFDFDTILSVVFEMDEMMDDVIYESVRLNGKKNSAYIILYSENNGELDSLEETIEDWFVKLGDEMHYVNESGLKLKISVEDIADLEEMEPCLIDAQGHLFSKRKQIDIKQLNELLELELALEESLFNEGFGNFLEFLDPDYATLFSLADEVKKLKPWNYFENGDILAVQLEDMKYFISVLGAGGQEFGLIMYDELFGYSSLEKIVYGEPLHEGYEYELSALTVNYVNRDELEAEDYELIKDHGLSYRGKNSWIAFRSYEPGCVPMLPDFEDVEVMIELLRIILAITKMRIGGWKYPNVPLNGYPLFVMEADGKVGMQGIITMERVDNREVEIELNDLDIARAKKKKKSTLELEYSLFYMQGEVIVEDGRPIFPLIAVAIDCASGEVTYHEVVPFAKHSFVQQQLFWLLLQHLPVRPHKVYVSAEMVVNLEPIAALVGVELAVSELLMIEQFKQIVSHDLPF